MIVSAQRLRLSGDQYGVDVTTLQLDLSSLESVREAADTCKAMLKPGQIDALQAIPCNAGRQFQGPILYSKDGYEETFATNYLGHFLLVNLLLDSISEKGRVVFTVSGTHDPATMDGKMVGIHQTQQEPRCCFGPHSALRLKRSVLRCASHTS